MITTHLSHYGLELVAKGTDTVVMTGCMSACKRMALAHGLELDNHVEDTSAAAGVTLYTEGAVIIKGATWDGSTLILPRRIWDAPG